MSELTEASVIAAALAERGQEEVLELAQAMHPDRLAGLVLRLHWLVALIDPNNWCEGCRRPIKLTDGQVVIDSGGSWHGPCRTAAGEGA